MANELGAQDYQAGTVTAVDYTNRVFNYVRQNIETSFSFGLTKGAYGTFVDQAGTDLDQSSLMAALLNVAGIQATYEAGTITLTANQFGAWTGLVVPTQVNADGTDQAFTVSQNAVCQLLANGGIPAAIDGSTQASCAYGGNLTNVTMGHVWLNVGGTRYDPSYKVYTLYAGKDLAAAMGCGSDAAQTCSTTALQAALGSATRGNVGGVPSTSNINTSAFEAQLKTYGTNLENFVVANGNNRAREWLIGGKIINPTASLALPAAPISYALISTLGSQVPDQYRIRFSIAVDNISSAFWADEIAGRRLRLFGNGGSEDIASGSNFTRSMTLYVDWIPIAQSTRPGATVYNDVMSIGVNYPLAAMSGTYLDGQYTRNLYSMLEFSTTSVGFNTVASYLKPITILHQFGPSYQHSLDIYGKRERNEIALVPMRYPNQKATLSPFMEGQTSIQNSCAQWTPFGSTTCMRLHQPTFLQSIIAQGSEMERVIGDLGKGNVGLLGAIGSVSDGAVNIEPLLSVVPNDGNSSAANGLRVAANLTPAWLEGGVNEQTAAVWEGMSGLSMLYRSMQQQIPLLDINSTNIASSQSQLQNYTSSDFQSMANFANAGLNVVAPKNLYLGSFSSTVQGVQNTLIVQTNGGAAFSGDYSMSAALERFVLKGGSAPEYDPLMFINKSTKPVDHAPRDRDLATVSPQDGTLALHPEPDLEIGSGEFPDKLSLTSSFVGNPDADIEEVTLTRAKGQQVARFEATEKGTSLGGGWSINLGGHLEIASDGFRALGSANALEASAVLPGLYALIKIGNAPASFDQRVGAIMSAYVAGEQTVLNNVQIDANLNKLSFVKLPSGRFSLPANKDWFLTTAGSLVGPYIVTGSSGSGFGTFMFSGETYKLTSPAGETYNFDIGGYNSTTVTGQITAIDFRYFKISNIVEPNGKTVNFTYTVGDITHTAPIYDTSFYDCLTTISSSIGHTINLSVLSGQHVCSLSQATDDAGNTVSYTPLNFSLEIQGQYSNPATVTLTRRDGKVETYNMNGVYDSAGSDGTFSRAAYDLANWVDADGNSLSWTYNGVGQATVEKDANNHSWTFRTGAGGSELWHENRVASPLGEVNLNQSKSGVNIASVDPLLRTTNMTLNEINQVVRTDLPGGGAIEKTYDIRGNVLTECRIALANGANHCSQANGDLLITTSYVEGPNIWPCVNFKICNKPAYVIDPKGFRMSYTWDPTHGGLLTETSGLDSSGNCVMSGSVCPVTTNGYTAFTGTDGATFYLLTSRQEKIDAATTRTTTWAYDSANKFVLKEQVVDSGGLALRTCFKFDGTGNLISKTEPRAGLGNCP